MNGQQNGRKEEKKRDAQKAPQKKSPEKNMSEIDEHILKRFDIKKRLGKGAYGIVWKATDRKTKETVAIKKIFDAFRNQTDAQRTFREIIFLQAFRNHSNIVKLHSIHRALNNRDIYLGFEYMETDLHCVIKRGNILKDIHKRYIMYQILKATKYIHSGNVIHRDQKPSNVLIDSACRVKLADFGLARSVSSLYRGGGGRASGGGGEEPEPCLTDYVATRWYRAPEILIASKNYTKGIDMWSLGCILGEMLTGRPLFPGSSTLNQIERIMAALPAPSQEDIASLCPGYGSSLLSEAAAAAAPGATLSALLSSAARDAADLVQRLLVFNPTKRLSAEKALDHEYVHKFHCPRTEPQLGADVVLPLRDDRQVSVDDYRNKLYSLMARPHHGTHARTHLASSKASPSVVSAKMSRSCHEREAGAGGAMGAGGRGVGVGGVGGGGGGAGRGHHPASAEPRRCKPTPVKEHKSADRPRGEYERARGDCCRLPPPPPYPLHPPYASHPPHPSQPVRLDKRYLFAPSAPAPAPAPAYSPAPARQLARESGGGAGGGAGARRAGGGYATITASAFMDLRTTMR